MRNVRKSDQRENSKASRVERGEATDRMPATFPPRFIPGPVPLSSELILTENCRLCFV